MAFGSQTPQESSARGKARRTPLQGTEYTARGTGAPPTLKYNNLEEWFQNVSTGHLFHGVLPLFAVSDIRSW